MQCPTANDIRELILEHFRREADEASASTLRTSILEFVDRLTPPPSNGSLLQSLADNFGNLPFEQFMGCLQAASATAALGSIQHLCGRSTAATPSVYHQGIVQLARELLGRHLCDQVTILTTNYDEGFEAAMGDSLKLRERTDWVARNAPTFDDMRVPLVLAKVHGSVDHPKTLVFSFASIGSGSIDPSYFSRVVKLLAQADLIVMMGYSLSDFDLRPVMNEALQRHRALTIWNERPNATRADDDDLRGLNYARERLIRENGILSYFSDLFVDDSNNILRALASPLNIDCPAIAPFTDLRSGLREQIRPLLPQLTTPEGQLETVLFLGHLADSCNAGDAVELLRPYAMDAADPRPNIAHLYLQALAHERNYPGVLRDVQLLSRRGRPAKVRMCAYAWAVFIHTFRAEVIQALKSAARGYSIAIAWRVSRSDASYLYLSHHWNHFLSRCTLGAGSWMRRFRWLSFAGVVVEVLGGNYLLWRYRSIARRVKPLGQMRLEAGCAEVAAQCAIMARRPLVAQKMAESMQSIYEQLQYFNGVGLGERTSAWACLARNSEEKIVEARQKLARCVEIGTRTPDRSLLPKFVANLLRVVAFELKKPPLAFLERKASVDASSAEEPIAEIIKAGRWFRRIDFLQNDIHVAAQHAVSLGNWLCWAYRTPDDGSRLRSALETYANVTKFPIFVITDPQVA